MQPVPCSLRCPWHHLDLEALRRQDCWCEKTSQSETDYCCAAAASHERSRYFFKQWICGANPMLKFTKKGMAYNLNADTYLATQTAVYLASVYGKRCFHCCLS